ncbi:hypothetical protein GLX27_000080 [Malassezia furfur]|uniref:UspA domain-containing protein n=1 Tax=Malassezia furfur TaxID=55194 RepID=A0ABY8EI07_MALFU|nr:hypothetical protein CBS14141_002221 [Malassezia furfur]WFD45460.1 hypothetical protein GLX27_000080 [Malassezia furfur]
MSAPTNTSDQGFFGVQHQTSTSGDVTPGGQVHQIAQTPVLESSNPFDKASIPSEARQQQIVGVPGERLPETQSKVLLALDGTEAGDKAFDYLLNNKTIAPGSHIFLTTVLPANVLGGPWVSGPLSIDTKKQNELLRQLRQQAVERMMPYKAKLKEKGFNVTMHVLHGDARASLLKVITYHKVDLVLIGKRNLGWKRGLTSGTVSSYLVSHSPVPVLVIK